MAKYLYPAVFEKDGEQYSVVFPDVPGCATCDSTLQEAYEMAEDALCMMLYSLEEESKPIPKASDISAIKVKDGRIVSLVKCDTVFYREWHDNRLVNKTVTIESWLNKMAERAHLNCSQLLRNAIKEKLNIL
jgi:predicted RNase H-like HicB family nuclease